MASKKSGAAKRSGAVNADLVSDIMRELVPEVAKMIAASMAPINELVTRTLGSVNDVVAKLTQLVEVMAAREQQPLSPPPVRAAAADGEAEKCRRSVVVLGLPEANGEPQARNAVDAASVRAMFNELSVDSVPANVYRMGAFDRQGKKTRPVKVEFTNMHDAVQVLRRSPELKTSANYGSVYVRKSHPHSLRVELINKRKSDPDNVYVIYNDKVVAREVHTQRTQSGDEEEGALVRRSGRPLLFTPEYAQYWASLQPGGSVSPATAL